MSLDPPPFLASLQNNIRQRPIPWEGAVRANVLTDDQLKRIRAVDKAKPDARRRMVEADLDGYCALFVGEPGKSSLLESSNSQSNYNIVRNILVLLSDLLDAVPPLAKALFRDSDPYRHFLPLLAQTSGPDDPIPIPLLTSTVLAALAASTRDESPATVQKALPVILSYLSTLTKNSDAGLQDIGVQQYSLLLYGSKSRRQFWSQRSETVAPLIDILCTAAGSSNGDSSSLRGSLRGSSVIEGSIGGGVGIQLLYHVLLVLWQLSFEAEEVGCDLEEEYNIISLYTQLLKLSPKEKTTRLLVSTLHNLLSANRASLLPVATLARLPGFLATLSSRQLTDPDLLEDLKQLREIVEEYMTTKTTFDEYAAEVRLGHLRWSPPHRSQAFWAENARRILEENNGEVVRQLADIMKKPWDGDKQVLAIACNDVGALVREVPERRSQLERLGLKTRVMELMGEADENVRWESLRALGGWLKYSFENSNGVGGNSK
ncbi:vacuolar ATP synthase subunit H [Gaeumannomyces tritici R3-111a-1]|uniref:V-type proton ATPase subunit H n=1 Tax=Gaeumannomyces tritici (strain R3-111a-1) TaxID=644352 RepID=J3NKQ8_GAET3|nr:vacuolar ATP synthase subunit H [Gaeumannomyces tritici R3-111a-1]EJT81875.1 vacuolar ATP synthase subunit H [Gaeumannomyces tritici R3-111a-1]